jgi:hypothetical protein
MLFRITIIWEEPFYTLCSHDLSSIFAWLWGIEQEKGGHFKNRTSLMAFSLIVSLTSLKYYGGICTKLLWKGRTIL